MSRPSLDDVGEVFAIFSDASAWEHSPGLRHVNVEATRSMVEAAQAGWDEFGLADWVIRWRGDPHVIGFGGCSPLSNIAWNIGGRFEASARRLGVGGEVAVEAVRCAREAKPDWPIVAYFVEANAGSAALTRKMGFQLVHRGPNTWDPDSADAVLFADRPMTDQQISATLRRLSVGQRVRGLREA